MHIACTPGPGTPPTASSPIMCQARRPANQDAVSRPPAQRVRFRDSQGELTLVFLTNQMTLDAETICALYKARWQVELFFKWIKQHLWIKSFFGYSENAVKTQIWIAVSVYVLIAIMRKRLGIETELYRMLQVLSVMPFERIA